MALGCLAGLLGCVQVARGDAIQNDQTLHANVTLLGIEADAMVFVFNDGRSTQWPVSGVKRIMLTAGNDPAATALSQAERARLAGDRRTAVTNYEEVLSNAGKEWLRDYATYRLVRLYDDMGQIQKCYRAYVALAVNRPGLVSGLLPRRIPRADSQPCREILIDIDQRIERSATPELTAALVRFRAAVLRTPQQPVANPRPPTATPPVAKPATPAGPSPLTLAIKRAREMIAKGDLAAADRVLETIRNKAPQAADAILLLEAERALAANDAAAAALAAMRLATEHPNSALVADAWWAAGRSQERLGRGAKAIELYQRCVAAPNGSAEARSAAEARLAAMNLATTQPAGGGA